MGQVRHGSATTTHAVRAAIQRSQASLATLSQELGINPKTVAKWRKRATVEDLKTGPKAPHSTTLTEAEEAAVVAFRRHTLLPLDDCLYALQPSIPHLSRSALHRCLQRHGISRLPDIEGDKPKRQRFKRYPIGFFHVDIAEVQTAEGKLYLFVGVDRTSKFAVTQLVDKADRRTAWERGGSRNLNSGDKWIADLTAAMLAAKRKQDEQATPPEPQSGIQGQGGAGCCEG